MIFGRSKDHAAKKKKAMDLHETLSGIQTETLDLSRRIDLNDPEFQARLAALVEEDRLAKEGGK